MAAKTDKPPKTEASAKPEDVPEVFQVPENIREDYRNDPNYGIDNYFLPIQEGIPSATYYELKANLAVPIRPEFISQKQKGWDKKTNQAILIDYVNVTDLKDQLDERVGVWTSEVISTTVTAAELLVVVRITIHASDGAFSQDGTGAEWLGHTGFGDTYSNAYAQAFRRACEGHGLGRALWRRDEIQDNQLGAQHHENNQQSEYNQERPQEDPVARSLGDMLSTKQLGLIRAISKEANIDADSECMLYLGCKVDELSKRAASNFIEHLNKAAKSAPVSTGVLPPASRSNNAWSGDQDTTSHSGAQSQSGPPATPKQKEYLSNLCQEKGQNEHLLALDLFKVEFENISKQQASSMIEHLLRK